MGRGLSQEELAFRADMSVPYLSDLERGRWNPSLAVMVDLADALEIAPAELLIGIKGPGAGAKEPDRTRRRRPRN